MSKGKLVAIVLVWLMLAGIGAVAFRYLYTPITEQIAEEERQQRIETGTSDSRYQHRVKLALDPFSGYAILRSAEFQQQLARKSIKLQLVDDGADYAQRLAALRSGDVPLAVFTIDALLKTSAAVNDLPATIVAMIDETRGADAIVGYKQRFQSIDDFNSRDVQFILTPDSPSETLARVVMTDYDVPNLTQDNIVPAKSAKDVYQQYRQSSPQDNKVYVLWEPFVSKILENPDVHTIVSSRDMFGYIVDVLVVQKEFLSVPANEELVRNIVECYFRTAFQHREQMQQLVRSDAAGSEPLTPQQAAHLVEGIQWKDTQRNYAHFGITDSSAQHVEDMIENITHVLQSTGAIAADPTGGRPNLLYYDQVLRDLFDAQFHPAGSSQTEDGSVADLPALTPRQWQSLRPVGTLKVPRLVFARGTSRLLDSSRRILDDLASTLSTHNHYLMIQGTATRAGDLELNRQLAEQRAQAAGDYLVQLGISSDRIRASGSIGDASAVTFTFGQVPY